MGAGHGHTVHFHGHSVVHRLPAHTKLAALVAFVLIVVATPRTAVWAFVTYAVLLLVLARASRVPARYLGKRLLIEIPFVVFAVLMPVVSTGPLIAVGPVSLSEPGLWAAWGLLAKGTIGVGASVLLGATTEPRDLVRALERARLPRQLVQIAAFMFRYLEVVGGELTRMRIARESRGFRARSVRAWPVLAATLGALFIRSYERGERVHLAMLSRGYAGRLPFPTDLTATRAEWARALALPGAAALCAGAAWLGVGG